MGRGRVTKADLAWSAACIILIFFGPWHGVFVMSEWIKCSDRLPPIRQKVLAYRLGKKTNDGPFFAMTCGNEIRPWRYIDGDRCDISITHWQPIPDPPTE